jgi:DNA-binding CsgD family transcriptional regulator
VILEEMTVSRRHARLTCLSPKSVLLEDLSSTNGTFVGEIRVDRCELTPPFRFQCGKVVLELNSAAPIPRAVQHFDGAGTEKDPTTLEKMCFPAKLTRAQRVVLSLTIEGLDEGQIAARLDRSPHTIHNHFRAIYAAYRVHSRAGLLAKLFGRQ